MIKLDKLQEPDVLRLNKAQWTQEYKTAKHSGAANIDELKNRYRHPEIKQQIVRETHEKCAYCESKIRHTYPGDIEHIKPKSDFEDDIFEYENLTLACGECNRRKNDNYDEDIGIMNPYEVEPEEHLLAYGPLIFPRPGDDTGKLAYELFDLNRTELIERRKDSLDYLQLQIDQYASEKNAVLKKLYKRKVEKFKDASNEYAMVKRTFIRRAMSTVKRQSGIPLQENI